MERFTRPLMEQYGVRIIIGKGGLGAASLARSRDLGGVYLAIIGGTAALETTWIEAIEDVDLDDLNPESLWKFRVRGFGRCWWRWTATAAASTTSVDARGARHGAPPRSRALGVKARVEADDANDSRPTS